MKEKIRKAILRFLGLDETLYELRQAINEHDFELDSDRQLISCFTHWFNPVIKFECLESFMPKKANNTDGGYDVFFSLDETKRKVKNLSVFGDELLIKPHEVIVIDCGNLKLNMPPNIECLVQPKSGLSSKGLSVSLGLVDETYHKPIGVIVTNTTNEGIKIKDHQKIAQLCFRLRLNTNLVRDIIQDTDRGGFGSTGL